MKKIFVLLLCVCLFIGLCGCKQDEPGYSYRICENVNLTLVARERHFSIYVHNETGVMYIAKEPMDCKYYGGISVMLDSNGDPLLWEGEVSE